MALRPIVAFLILAACDATAADAVPDYVLRYDAKTESMDVRLCLPRAAANVYFGAEKAAPRFIDHVTRSSAAPPPERDEDGWSASNWQAGECLSYHASFGPIVDTTARNGGARHGSSLVVDPESWLLRANAARTDAGADVRVTLPAGYSISAPWHPLPSNDAERHFSLPNTPEDWIARVAIGRFDEKPVAVTGGTLRIAMLDGIGGAQRAMLSTWLARVSRAALSAYGRLPLADVQVLIVPVADEHGHEPVVFGQSSRGQGHALTLFVDPIEPASAFDRDWVAVHEFSHLFHPYLGDSGSWLAEGLATYYQNVLRARAELLTPAEAWEQLDAGFARGRSQTPGADNIALELAASDMLARHAVMRIYWTGTAYWLTVDTDLRRASGNKLSIDEALRRFDACCLLGSRTWNAADFVAKLDELIGTDVFVKRFREFRMRRDFPDLKNIYANLGIHQNGDTLSFDDDAPGANIRRAIMTARAGE